MGVNEEYGYLIANQIGWRICQVILLILNIMNQYLKNTGTLCPNERYCM